MQKIVTFWCPYIGQVGTINAVLEAAKSLSNKKHYKCKIINSYGEFDNYKNFLNENKIEKIDLLGNNFIKNLPKEGYFWSRINYILIFFLCFIPLLRYLKNNKNEFLFIYLITSLPLFIISLFNLDNKVILRVSGKINFSFLRKINFIFASKKIVKILVQTNESRKRLVLSNLFEKNKIKILRDPIIDFKKINCLKKKKIKNSFRKNRYFISIGRLTKQKNFLFLLKCIKEIIIKEKRFKFLILGEGNERYKLEQFIKKNKLSNFVHILGFKKNIYNYIENSFGLISTSLWEEPGFVIQEASACKKIVLCSDCYTGPSEFLDHGKIGYVFKSNNKYSFIKEFSDLLAEKKIHKDKIKKSFLKTKLYTNNYFFKQIDRILVNLN